MSQTELETRIFHRRVACSPLGAGMLWRGHKSSTMPLIARSHSADIEKEHSPKNHGERFQLPRVLLANDSRRHCPLNVPEDGGKSDHKAPKHSDSNAVQVQDCNPKHATNLGHDQQRHREFQMMWERPWTTLTHGVHREVCAALRAPIRRQRPNVVPARRAGHIAVREIGAKVEGVVPHTS